MTLVHKHANAPGPDHFDGDTYTPAHFKQLRQLAGLTQAELGDMLGVDKVSILGIEKAPGKFNVRTAQMRQDWIRVCKEVGAAKWKLLRSF